MTDERNLINTDLTPDMLGVPESSDSPLATEISGIIADARTLVGDILASVDYATFEKKLEEVQTAEDLFFEINKYVDETFVKDGRVLGVVNRIGAFVGPEEFDEATRGALVESVKLNDFDCLPFKKTSIGYRMALVLAATKNRLTKEITLSALEKHAERLGLSKAEQAMTSASLDMGLTMDVVYIKWRNELYPEDVRDRLSSSEDPTEEASNMGYDDPYAVIRKVDGECQSVPYALAFPNEYQKLDTMLDGLTGEFSGMDASDFGEGYDKDALLAYLQAYKTALGYKKSRKGEDGEWSSVGLWKEVDRKWLKCHGRLQMGHAIETGYEASIDPSKSKVIPEFRLTFKMVNQSTDKMIGTMQNADVAAMEEVFDHPDPRIFGLVPKSHVVIGAVLLGGGNSMDGRGSAQIGPNYKDVYREDGAKVFMDFRAKSALLREKVARSVFGEGPWTLQEGSEDHSHFIAQYLGAHEVGHLTLGQDIPLLEETKATWFGMVGMYERVKKGELPEHLIELAMAEHVKYCLKQLAEMDEETNDYVSEGIANMRLFFQTGLIAKGSDGSYKFHPEKTEETYLRIKELFVSLVGHFNVTPDEITPDDSYKEWSTSLTDVHGEFEGELTELGAFSKKALLGRPEERQPEARA